MTTPNGGDLPGGDELTAKQRQAIEALAAGLDITTAAKVAGVVRQTVHKWQRDPAFAAELAGLEAEAIATTGRRLLTLQTKAVAVVEKVLDGRAHPSIKLQAARLVIDAALRLRELRNIEERLAALEAAMNERKG